MISVSLRESGHNLKDRNFIEAVYKTEVQDFNHGIWSEIRESQPEIFALKKAEYLEQLTSDKSEHIRRSISHISKKQNSQAIIIIDNADQRSLEIQQEAFVIAHELSSNWDALIFLSLRPQTFHSSKRSGTVSAYPPRVFVISPPKLEDVIEKRLLFALKIAEGKISPASKTNISLHLGSLATVIRTLQHSLLKNKDLYEFIVNVSSGNVRIAIELITRFIGNPNIETDRIVKLVEEGEDYVIPVHEFAKVGLLGDYAYYQEDASLAYNVYAPIFPDKREHFISLLLLSYLSWEGAQREQADGFLSTKAIAIQMQNLGFSEQQLVAHVKKLTRRKLIESSERRLLETDSSDAVSTLPECFRVTSLGAYHVKIWAYEFSFLEAMAFDTPIFEKQVLSQMMNNINEQNLVSRHARAVAFRDYLDSIWSSITAPPYFNWYHFKEIGSDSFKRVEKSLRDHGKL